MYSSLKLAIVALALAAASAFTVAPEAKRSTNTMLFESRRGFMAASVGVVGFLASGMAPAFAVDDLAMPTAEEEAAQKVSAAMLCSP
jgi:hypothetical protein